ncbi:MAG: ABC transporter permease subunit [Pseudomonadota bacterium]
MGPYILRRLLLIIPTLLGIMLVNFVVIQFAPGGPVEQVIAELNQADASATGRISGGGGDLQGGGDAADAGYRGARGIDPAIIADLEAQFGFVRVVCDDGYEGPVKVSAKECRVSVVCEPGYEGPQTLDAAECEKERIPAYERFFTMVLKYLTFDFGESYSKSRPVIDLILEKLPVSLSLGFWTFVLSYSISIPLGIRKAVQDGTPFDSWTSGVVIIGYAIPNFLFAVLLLVYFAGGSYFQWFPLRGLASDGWENMNLLEKIADYFWHICLPILSMAVSGFATLTLLTKNSFLDEIKKQYVLTARAKGLVESRVLYGHVFRNAMLIVIAGFPSAFILLFTTGALLIESVFSLDGLGLLGFEAIVGRDYPLVFGTLYIFSLVALVAQLITDITYTLIDPRIDFESRAV